MFLNVSVAGYICQIRVESKKYFTRFKREYRYLKNPKKIDWHINIKDTELLYPRVEPNKKQNSATFYFPHKRFSLKDLMSFTTVAISTLIVGHDILVLHASSLVINGFAYVFCGPSGAGKSTIIRLAKDCISLSGDTTVIKKEKNRYFIYPSNFDSGKCRTLGYHKAPLAKIFYLHQSDRTAIKPVNSVDMIQQLIKYNMLSFIDYSKEKVDLYKATLELASSVAIQQLHFTKSREFLSFL